MSVSKNYLTKTNVLEAISISKLIVNDNLVGKRLSNSDEEKGNLEKYNQNVKSKIEVFKNKYGGNTPNKLLRLFLNDYLVKKGYADKFETKGFPYYGQIINPYVWAAITKKDNTYSSGKTSFFPQLYILINNLDIHFGFCYGNYVKTDDKCVNIVKSDNRIKQQLLDISNQNREIHVFSSYDQINNINNPELKFNNFQDIDDNWTKDVHVIDIIKETEISDDIDEKISQTLDGLFELLLKTSEIEHPDSIKTEVKQIKNEYPIISRLLSNKKQVIFYGPPGTGKTYQANNFIHSSGIQGYDLLKETLSDQRIFSVTIYEPRDGRVRELKEGETFKYIWNDENSKNSGSRGGRNYQNFFEEIQEGDIAFAYTAVEPKGYTTIVKCTQKSADYLIFEIIKQFKGPRYKQIKESPLFVNSRLRAGTMSFSLLKLSEKDIKAIMALSNEISPNILGINFEPSKEMKKNTQFVTFHPSFAYEDFIEGLRPVTDENGKISYNIEDGIFKKISYDAFNVLLDHAGLNVSWEESTDIPDLTSKDKEILKKLAPKVPFYLIIDEINRGDMSRIFGELITLLEADKRYCEDNELVTTLPYSKNKFAIPPNLYIIGTMNTADKSIALVDIALRRRFGFIEMMPDYNVLEKNLTSSDKKIQEIYDLAILVLKNINENILKNYDRDHQIGHSYLLKLKESKSRSDAIENLCFIWYYEILPLMQEYFYDSPKKLKQVIGDGFIEIENHSFSCKDHLEGEIFIKTLQKMVMSEKILPETEE
ncbi:MAG: AAA family ATPase [Methanomicrobiaceae archaeon]|nr:AAA family ATPase [Methanomicrobiaceae archaeon]